MKGETIIRTLFCVVLASAILVSTALAEASRIQLPTNYKETFTNYLSLDRTQNADQIIHLYANDIALNGIRSNGEFPDGSVLVGEVYKAKKDSDGKILESALGRRLQGNLAIVAVMEKQKGWGDKFPPGLKNGDWDFATFKADGDVVKKDLNTCRACHSPLRNFQNVFSYEHLK